MLEYEKIDFLEGIDQNKSPSSGECNVCHCWFFIDRNFNYDNYLCNGCSDVMLKSISFKNVAIIYSKGNACRINFFFMTKNEVTKLLNDSVLNSKGVLQWILVQIKHQ